MELKRAHDSLAFTFSFQVEPSHNITNFTMYIARAKCINCNSLSVLEIFES